jgi:hydrogenase maturation protease
MTRDVCVVGLGNSLLQDDGVGLHAMEAIKAGYEFEPEIDLIDGGTAGLDLLPLIEGYKKVLFIDAADTGRPPGTVVVIEGDAIPSFLTHQRSVHHIGLSDLLFAARMADVLPVEVCLVGVQPESIDLGLELTDSIKNSLDSLIAAVVGRLQSWGVQAVRR